jgi:hypothetical protein
MGRLPDTRRLSFLISFNERHKAALPPHFPTKEEQRGINVPPCKETDVHSQDR